MVGQEDFMTGRLYGCGCDEFSGMHDGFEERGANENNGVEMEPKEKLP